MADLVFEIGNTTLPKSLMETGRWDRREKGLGFSICSPQARKQSRSHPSGSATNGRRHCFPSAAGSAERGYHVGGVSKVTAQLTMELSEPVQSGLQILADPGSFSLRAFQALLQAAFQSLLSGQAEEAVFDYPDLKNIDPAILKYCHAATTTCIIEAGKQKADQSIISTYLEDCKLDRERIEKFCTEYQKHKDTLEIILGSIGRCPLHITDVCWRLEYQIKTNQLHKNYRPAYLMTLKVENKDSRSHQDINFSCSMEQLQDLVGKLKDAAKSLERTTQL